MRWELLGLSFLLQLETLLVYATDSTPQASFEKMLHLRAQHGYVIKGDSDIFKKYIKPKHSKYSVVAMFTALKPASRCEVCPLAYKEFSILASSYKDDPSAKTVFFVTIDYQESREAFQMMKLQHVPAFYYFPSDRKRKKIDTYDARRSGYFAMPLARWLEDVDNIKIKVTVPVDYTKLITPSIVAVIIGILLYAVPEYFMRVFGNKTLWGSTILVVVLLMTSGQMWNHIRRPANYGRSGQGVEYILGSRSGQYVLESYIIMSINGAITVGFILLNGVEWVKKGVLKKSFGFIGLGVVAAFFGVLISLFRVKSRGYPYSFLFE